MGRLSLHKSGWLGSACAISRWELILTVFRGVFGKEERIALVGMSLEGPEWSLSTTNTLSKEALSNWPLLKGKGR